MSPLLGSWHFWLSSWYCMVPRLYLNLLISIWFCTAVTRNGCCCYYSYDQHNNCTLHSYFLFITTDWSWIYQIINWWSLLLPATNLPSLLTSTLFTPLFSPLKTFTILFYLMSHWIMSDSFDLFRLPSYPLKINRSLLSIVLISMSWPLRYSWHPIYYCTSFLLFSIITIPPTGYIK